MLAPQSAQFFASRPTILYHCLYTYSINLSVWVNKIFDVFVISYVS